MADSRGAAVAAGTVLAGFGLVAGLVVGLVVAAGVAGGA